MINYINSGLTITMTTAAVSTSVGIIPSSLVVHTSTTYTISISFSVLHVATDYLILEVPSSMEILASAVCSPISGVAVITCTVPTKSTIKIVLASIPVSNIEFSITSIRNYDISSTSVPFICNIYTTAGYLM